MKRALCILALLAGFAPRAGAMLDLRYQIHVDPVLGRVHVRISFPKSLAGGVLVMPRAVPMGYSQVPYDRFVEKVQSGIASERLSAARRLDGPRWQFGAVEGAAFVEYDVNLARMEREILAGGDASRVRPGYVFLLGYSVFGFVEGYEDWPTPICLEVVAPKGWPVCATLAPATPCARGRVEATAANFYALADSQIVVGNKVSIVRVETKVAAPLYVAVYAESEVDTARIATVSREAYEHLVAYFGSAPFSHYMAVYEFLRPVSPAHTYGFSMEHLQSATFCLPPQRALTKQSSERDTNLFRVNVAHHIAHAWVPKRAYGQGYFPFSWEVAPAHDSIWFSEGFGQYAALDAPADEQPAEQRAVYLDRMLELRYRSTLREMPKFLLEMPLVQLSYRGSYMYSEDFRIGRTLFSRGALMAAEMDARMRQRTQGVKRMRDAFRYLVAWRAKNQRAFQIEELPVIFREATGVETRDILEKWLGPFRAQN